MAKKKIVSEEAAPVVESADQEIECCGEDCGQCEDVNEALPTSPDGGESESDLDDLSCALHNIRVTDWTPNALRPRVTLLTFALQQGGVTLGIRPSEIVGFICRAEHPETLILKGGAQIPLATLQGSRAAQAVENLDSYKVWKSEKDL